MRITEIADDIEFPWPDDHPGHIEASYDPVSKSAYISNIDVGRSQQQGIGRQVIAKFEQWVREQGGKIIRGHSVLGATGFWERLGYKVRYSREDDGYIPFDKRLKG